MIGLIGSLLQTLIQILIWAFIGRAVISWLVVAGVRNDLVFRLNYALGVITEPVIAPLRKYIPPMGMIDITPMVAIIILFILSRIVSAVF